MCNRGGAAEARGRAPPHPSGERHAHLARSAHPSSAREPLVLLTYLLTHLHTHTLTHLGPLTPPLQVSLSCYSLAELTAAKHTNELKPSSRCLHLHVDAQHMGVGGHDSWTALRTVGEDYYVRPAQRCLLRLRFGAPRLKPVPTSHSSLATSHWPLHAGHFTLATSHWPPTPSH